MAFRLAVAAVLSKLFDSPAAGVSTRAAVNRPYQVRSHRRLMNPRKRTSRAKRKHHRQK